VVLDLEHDSGFDLVVAGHTHGGQVQLPLFGPAITLTGVPRHVAAGGQHEINGNLIYVSRGVGIERGQAPRLRFMCPPEIAILELK
jgi:predicted MPP superfamily phosphohydrolase